MTALQQLWHLEQPYVDPLWAYVKTLLQFNNNTLDASLANMSYSAVNGTVNGAFDSTAANSSVVGGLTSPHGVSNQDFCLEYYFYDTGIYNFYNYHFLMEGSGGSGSIGFWKTGGGGGAVLLNTVGSWPTLPADFAYSTNIWNHLAVTRYNDNWTIYLNGVVVGSFYWVRNFTLLNQFWIGNASGMGSSARMLIDEWRVTVGHRRYTGPGFTARRPFPTRGP